MLGARVPKATVDEHGDSWSQEHNIRSDPPPTGVDREVRAKAKAMLKQERTNGDFRLRVTAAVRPHRCHSRFTTWARVELTAF